MPQMWNAKEHRWGERVRVNIQVQVSPGSEAGIGGRIENLERRADEGRLGATGQLTHRGDHPTGTAIAPHDVREGTHCAYG